MATTPLSPSSTLTPSSPVLTKCLPLPYSSNASTLVELISSRSTTTSTLFVYDLAEQADFGSLNKTRAGAGLSLVGRLSQGTSRDALTGSVLTAYSTPPGLAEMIPSLAYSPPPTPNSRLVLQIPTVSAIGDRLTLSPTLAALNPVLSILPESFVVILSATPQETVDLAALAYAFPAHVIHLFDHHRSSREVSQSQLQIPSFPSKEQVGDSVQSVLLQSGYRSFDYTGDKDASIVIVVLNGPLALALKGNLANIPNIGLLAVRVLRPWDEEAFRGVLPSTVRHIYVIEDAPLHATRGIVHADVQGSVLSLSGPTPNIHHEAVTPSRLSELLSNPSSLVHLLTDSPLFPSDIMPRDVATATKLLFFSTPGTPLSSVPERVEKTFAHSASVSMRSLSEHDILTRPGGITADRICLEPRNYRGSHTPLSVNLPISGDSGGACHFLAVLDQSLLKSHSLLKHAKRGASVLVTTSWSVPELVSNLSVKDITLIRDRELNLYTINPGAIASLVRSSDPAQSSLLGLIVHLAFLLLYLGSRASHAAILKLTESLYGTTVDEIPMTTLIARVWEGLLQVDLSAIAAEQSDAQEPRKDFEFNAIAVAAENGEAVSNGARLGTWHDAARHMLFPHAFIEQVTWSNSTEQHPQIPTLHPEISDRTYLVTCTVNRRLTPREYDRNVFHVEFDTTGTGLKYAIGEALGIHGWNDEADVLDFCSWYGVDPDRLVTISVPGSDTKVHTRTIFQVFQQQIDIFGKPPKSFYSDLAKYARSSVDRHALLFIGSPEGVSTFKKLSEKDTVTFADVLRQYKSARPGIEALCELIGDIKPRHYSIASCAELTVDWQTPSGTTRYGQCTRYLAGLQIGQKVTVSIKPSVMKLPAEPTQPLIMAGLGTGAAPFRAFLQHRTLLASQGVPLGPVYYYFGSRHQSQEYLYGEEIEAFIEEGIITKAGLAFSRDGPKKVYIQHKMLDDMEALARMLHKDQGVFYLCGPTWPVPDVYETLVKAFERHCGMDVKAADSFIEDMKGEERYVLEVY
ncbi:assimilatory sulfite reductase [Russula earlei]|uniref:Assimilatory sulfite reductase n=1 Tax=Russula earlei TaxID=71964 RepID=A0ACC0UNK7_9AGAM|nr:assimilatory sulfite reductase [Russula earlei]